MMPEQKRMRGNASTRQAAESIDIEKLTEKVYQLMRADMRLAHARGSKHNTRK